MQCLLHKFRRFYSSNIQCSWYVLYLFFPYRCSHCTQINDFILSDSPGAMKLISFNLMQNSNNTKIVENCIESDKLSEI